MSWKAGTGRIAVGLQATPQRIEKEGKDVELPPGHVVNVMRMDFELIPKS
jgi:hypothetical protein